MFYLVFFLFSRHGFLFLLIFGLGFYDLRLFFFFDDGGGVYVICFLFFLSFFRFFFSFNARITYSMLRENRKKKS